MKTQVEFCSLKFPAYEGEEEQVNPGIWGRRLAEYLVEKLAAHGIQTGVIVPEDWGYYVPIPNNGFRLAVCCSHQSDADDQFLVFTNPGTPRVRKFLRTIDATPQLTRLLEVLRQILEADPEIHEIVWSEPL